MVKKTVNGLETGICECFSVDLNVEMTCRIEFTGKSKLLNNWVNLLSFPLLLDKIHFFVTSAMEYLEWNTEKKQCSGWYSVSRTILSNVYVLLLRL